MLCAYITLRSDYQQVFPTARFPCYIYVRDESFMLTHIIRNFETVSLPVYTICIKCNIWLFFFFKGRN